MDDLAFLKRLRELREMAALPDVPTRQTLQEMIDSMIEYLQHRVRVEDSSILEDRSR